MSHSKVDRCTVTCGSLHHLSKDSWYVHLVLSRFLCLLTFHDRVSWLAAPKLTLVISTVRYSYSTYSGVWLRLLMAWTDAVILIDRFVVLIEIFGETILSFVLFIDIFNKLHDSIPSQSNVSHSIENHLVRDFIVATKNLSVLARFYSVDVSFVPQPNSYHGCANINKN